MGNRCIKQNVESVSKTHLLCSAKDDKSTVCSYTLGI